MDVSETPGLALCHEWLVELQYVERWAFLLYWYVLTVAFFSQKLNSSGQPCQVYSAPPDLASSARQLAHKPFHAPKRPRMYTWGFYSMQRKNQSPAWDPASMYIYILFIISCPSPPKPHPFHLRAAAGGRWDADPIDGNPPSNANVLPGSVHPMAKSGWRLIFIHKNIWDRKRSFQILKPLWPLGGWEDTSQKRNSRATRIRVYGCAYIYIYIYICNCCRIENFFFLFTQISIYVNYRFFGVFEHIHAWY